MFDESEKEIIRLRDAGAPEVYTRRFVKFKAANFSRFPTQFIVAPLDWPEKIFYDLEYKWPHNPHLHLMKADN